MTAHELNNAAAASLTQSLAKGKVAIAAGYPLG